MTNAPPTTANQLAEALSPYLQQHKDNPVHWREWSDVALAEARDLDRPILLSVGYAACHWCHVMAHESFDDEAVADVMNRLFVNIKVDREERPDIDHLYMAALHAMGEQGGWPMTMFLTPDGRPFWGGTYFPKQASHGRPGFVQVLEAIGKAWIEQRGEIEQSGGTFARHLEATLSQTDTPGAIPDAPIDSLAPAIFEAIDQKRGGLRGAPKFPNAPYMEIIARSAFPAGPSDHRAAFLTTLDALCNGGIYDHVGGGLHRYSTDARWLVPHFEKMLYDNAQFLRHLAWGWRATGRLLFRSRVDQTISWLQREMMVDGGGFAASLDADSLDASGHPEEGAFYVWTKGEIEAALGDRAAAFLDAYEVTNRGNWEGRSILHRLHPGGAGSDDHSSELDALRFLRAKRAHPGRDDKVLADWNGMTIRALAEAAMAFDHREALVLAENAFAFVMSAMTRDGRLHHVWRDGRCAGLALSSDFGALIAAAVFLFAATGKTGYLDHAEELANGLDRWHGDGQGGFFLTASDASDVIVRPRGDRDDAIPGGTALTIDALALLAQATGAPAAYERARRAAESAIGRIAANLGGSPAVVCALDRVQHASELALLGSNADTEFGKMVSAANRWPDLNRLDLRLDDPTVLPVDAPLRSAPAKRPTALLCYDRACMPPVSTADALDDLFARAVDWRTPPIS
ncbi:thioredoxin domain-containing protein [Consotaella aegiceratis]|uniref:thioredoxin domain-containing protein n=1 Tax=Consotaella aegiceratis TaxID=3097961 RepID=UPI002F421B10